MQKRIDSLIKFLTDFSRILAPFGRLLDSHVSSKIAPKGGTVTKARGLWQRLRAKGAKGYPETPKRPPEGTPWTAQRSPKTLKMGSNSTLYPIFPVARSGLVGSRRGVKNFQLFF